MDDAPATERSSAVDKSTVTEGFGAVDQALGNVINEIKALEAKLDGIQRTTVEIAEILQSRMPPSGALETITTTLVLERDRRRSFEARVEQLESDLNAFKRLFR
jgi:hypothetical protein